MSEATLLLGIRSHLIEWDLLPGKHVLYIKGQEQMEKILGRKLYRHAAKIHNNTEWNVSQFSLFHIHYWEFNAIDFNAFGCIFVNNLGMPVNKALITTCNRGLLAFGLILPIIICKIPTARSASKME